MPRGLRLDKPAHRNEVCCHRVVDKMADESDSSDTEAYWTEESDDDEVLSADARRGMRQENEDSVDSDSDDEGREFDGLHASDTYTTP